MSWTVQELSRAVEALHDTAEYHAAPSHSERMQLCLQWLSEQAMDEAAFQQAADLVAKWPERRLRRLRQEILAMERPTPSRAPTVLTHDFEHRPYVEPITVTEGALIPPAPETWLRTRIREILWQGGSRVPA